MMGQTSASAQRPELGLQNLYVRKQGIEVPLAIPAWGSRHRLYGLLATRPNMIGKL